jgi:hypothetical protein
MIFGPTGLLPERDMSFFTGQTVSVFFRGIKLVYAVSRRVSPYPREWEAQREEEKNYFGL